MYPRYIEGQPGVGGVTARTRMSKTYTHVKDDVVELCAQMGILITVLPPHCTHMLQREGLYHFGKFKGAFRVAHAEIHPLPFLDDFRGVVDFLGCAAW